MILAIPALANDRPKVTVVATPNPLPENESLQLRVEIVTKGTAQIYRPEFSAEEFTSVGSGFSGGTTSIVENGNIQLEKRAVYTFVLFPKRSGVLTISDISVRVGSEEIRTEDIRIKVLEEGNSPPTPRATADEEDASNPAAPRNFQTNGGTSSSPSAGGTSDHPLSFNSDFTVFADVSRTKVYVGEPVVVDFYIYDLGGVRQLEIQKWPNFAGFWKEDLELVTRYQFEDVYVKNQRMRRAFLGRFALYPIKPGKLRLDKLVVTGRYVARNFFNADDDTDPLNIFMGGFGPLRSGTHASQDVTVEVLPLPEEGRPQGFGGAVGQFSIKLDTDKNSVPANTPINLTITVEGKGNFQAIDAFRLPLPPDFELYESAASSRGSNPIGMRRSLESRKTFQYVVIPRKAGSFQIPPISWSFFDPEKKEYRSIQTAPLEIQVTESANAPQGQNNNYLTQGTSTQTSVEEELRYLKAEPSRPGLPWTQILWGLVAAIGAVNLVLAVRLVRKRAAKWVDPIFERNRFHAALKEVAVLKKSNKTSFSELEEIILGVIQDVLGMNPRGMTRQELEDAWRSKGLPFEAYQKTHSFLDQMDELRFGGTKQDPVRARNRLFSEAEEIIRTAERIKK